MQRTSTLDNLKIPVSLWLLKKSELLWTLTIFSKHEFNLSSECRWNSIPFANICLSTSGLYKTVSSCSFAPVCNYPLSETFTHTSHNFHIFQITNLAYPSEFWMFQKFSNPYHFRQFSNNAFFRNKPILKFINTWELLNFL